jgi:hypothetical protein
MKPKHAYLVLCVLGVLLPYSQLAPYMLESGFDIPVVMEILFSSRISAFIALDLFVSAMTFLAFAWVEGKRIGMREFWIPIAGTFLVGVSLGFPLFLYLREIKAGSDGD